MNQKRKAELQRKLAMTSVPKPPAGLSERLKADIPANLMSVERDRERFKRSTTFSMGVAASILLLVTSAYVALHLMSRSETQIASEPPSMIRRPAATPPAPQAEVTITLAENDKDINTGKLSEVRPALRRQRVVAQVRDDEEALEEKKQLNERPRSTEMANRVADTAASAPAVAPPLPPPPPPAEVAEGQTRAPQPAAAKVESMTITANAPAIVSNVHADEISYKPPRAIFGLSIDPSAFTRVKQEIEKGERPAAGTIDIAGVVNYFAGSGRAPRRAVRLDVEASRSPLGDANTALLRFTIDTPHEPQTIGSSVPPVATDADLTITLNGNVVTSNRLIGAERLKSQSTLLKNSSVTGLMEVKLMPGLPAGTRIATLLFRYRPVSDGKLRTIRREVHAFEVARKWESASVRHRLATLGAAWTESLTDVASAGDVARTAQKFAMEIPSDPRARELAALASASSRLQSSGPTGSGR